MRLCLQDKGLFKARSPPIPSQRLVLLQAARRARRGTSGDQLLSGPPLYSGSISGGAAYARCQSSA